MKEYRNIFKEKSKEELLVLYKEFLESEKLGYIPNNNLGKIREEYYEYFGSNVLFAVQVDLLHTVADLWYEDNSLD